METLSKKSTSASAAQNPDASPSEQEMQGIPPWLAKAIDDEFLGAGGRDRIPYGTFGMMCRVTVTQSTLRQAVLLGCTCYNLHLHNFRIRLKTHRGIAMIILQRRGDSGEVDDFLANHILTSIHRYCCWLINQSIDLPSTPLATKSPCLQFDAEFLDYPVMQTIPTLRSFLRGLPASLMDSQKNAKIITSRIIRFIGVDLNRELPLFNEIATEFHMSPQTLRRRLKEEGSSYQEIKDTLRQNAAIAMLSQAQFSVTDVASRMGFSDGSTFSRAFKKWTGHTPAFYRNKTNCT